MKCHSTECGTLKSYRVVCKCQYFALGTLSGTKPNILTPKRYDEYPRPLFVLESPPGDCRCRSCDHTTLCCLWQSQSTWENRDPHRIRDHGECSLMWSLLLLEFLCVGIESAIFLPLFSVIWINLHNAECD